MVAGAIAGWLFSARDTVECETPARTANSLIVILLKFFNLFGYYNETMHTFAANVCISIAAKFAASRCPIIHRHLLLPCFGPSMADREKSWRMRKLHLDTIVVFLNIVLT